MSDWNKKIYDRIIAKRKITSRGCWEYTGYRDVHGYGLIRYKAVGYRRVHRIFYSLVNEKFSLNSKLFVCHHCDNPPCFNPEHLFAGTARDNTYDMLRKGRRVIAILPLGEENKSSKLKTKEVIEIKRLLALPKDRAMTLRKIAEIFNIHHTTVLLIKKGKHWAHVQP